jgi:glycosyltransferase involved in cell wall biosynthesis
MRVVHVTPYYTPEVEFGGPPATVHELCRALRDAGVETHVVTTAATAGEEVIDEVRVTRVRRRTRLGFGAPIDRALDASLRDADACHVHALFNWPAWRGAARARRQGRPTVVSTRGMLEPAALAHHKHRKQLAWHLMDRRVLATASAVVAATDAEAASLAARGLTPVVLPNAIDMPASLPARGSFRTSRRIVPEARVITFLGRLHAIKRLDLVADAFVDVASRDGRAVLVIAGPDEEGIRSAVAHRLVSVADRVHWLGSISTPHKWQLLADSDALVLCSDSESFGRVVAEALAAGVPPIVTESCPWDVLESEQIGRWVPQRALAIADAVVALLSDPQKHRAMSARGRAYARAHFSWDEVVAQYVALYESVCSPAHAPAIAARTGF